MKTLKHRKLYAVAKVLVGAPSQQTARLIEQRESEADLLNPVRRFELKRKATSKNGNSKSELIWGRRTRLWRT